MNTLFDYYSSKGKTLPGLRDRFSDPDFAAAASRAGVNQGAYTGSAAQNTSILRQLESGGNVQAPTLPATGKPTTVDQLPEVPDVVDSSGVAAEFDKSSQALDEKIKSPFAKPVQPAKTTAEDAQKLTKIKPTGLSDLDLFANSREDETLKWQEEQSAQIESLKSLQITNIDASYKAEVERIGTTYGKLIKQQERANKVAIDRRKAYGLSGPVMADPIGFTDAVSEAEKKAAESITALESERNSLLSQAKVARDRGEADVLVSTMDLINKVEQQAYNRLQDIQKDVEARAKAFQEQLEKEEKSQQERVKRFVEAAQNYYLDSFRKAPTREEKEKLVMSIMESNGILPDARDIFFDLYTSLNSVSVERDRQDIEDESKRLDLDEKRIKSKYTEQKEQLDVQSKKLDIATKQKNLAKGNGDSDKTIKFTTEESKRLLAAGFNTEDIKNIQTDVNKYGIDAVIDGMSPEQQKAVKNVLGGITQAQEVQAEKDQKKQAEDEKQFLNKDYFRKLYSEQQLKDEAKKAGYINKKRLARDTADTEGYLGSLEGIVQQYREAGYTDKEILKMMQ